MTWQILIGAHLTCIKVHCPCIIIHKRIYDIENIKVHNLKRQST